LQVVNYLSKYVSSGAAAVEEKKADLSAPAGFALMQKKETDEADAWLLGTSKKAKGGKSKAKKGERRSLAEGGAGCEVCGWHLGRL
jgi:hypothetical protein